MSSSPIKTKMTELVKKHVRHRLGANNNPDAENLVAAIENRLKQRINPMRKKLIAQKINKTYKISNMNESMVHNKIIRAHGNTTTPVTIANMNAVLRNEYHIKTNKTNGKKIIKPRITPKMREVMRIIATSTLPEFHKEAMRRLVHLKQYTNESGVNSADVRRMVKEMEAKVARNAAAAAAAAARAAVRPNVPPGPPPPGPPPPGPHNGNNNVLPEPPRNNRQRKPIYQFVRGANVKARVKTSSNNVHRIFTNPNIPPHEAAYKILIARGTLPTRKKGWIMNQMNWNELSKNISANARNKSIIRYIRMMLAISPPYKNRTGNRPQLAVIPGINTMNNAAFNALLAGANTTGNRRGAGLRAAIINKTVGATKLGWKYKKEIATVAAALTGAGVGAKFAAPVASKIGGVLSLLTKLGVPRSVAAELAPTIAKASSPLNKAAMNKLENLRSKIIRNIGPAGRAQNVKNLYGSPNNRANAAITKMRKALEAGKTLNDPNVSQAFYNAVYPRAKATKNGNLLQQGMDPKLTAMTLGAVGGTTAGLTAAAFAAPAAATAAGAQAAAARALAARHIGSMSAGVSSAAAAANQFIPGAGGFIKNKATSIGGAIKNQASSHIGRIGGHIGSGIASLGKKHLPMFGNQWNAAGKALGNTAARSAERALRAAGNEQKRRTGLVSARAAWANATNYAAQGRAAANAWNKAKSNAERLVLERQANNAWKQANANANRLAKEAAAAKRTANQKSSDIAAANIAKTLNLAAKRAERESQSVKGHIERIRKAKAAANAAGRRQSTQNAGHRQNLAQGTKKQQIRTALRRRINGKHLTTNEQNRIAALSNTRSNSVRAALDAPTNRMARNLLDSNNF